MTFCNKFRSYPAVKLSVCKSVSPAHPEDRSVAFSLEC